MKMTFMITTYATLLLLLLLGGAAQTQALGQGHQEDAGADTYQW